MAEIIWTDSALSDLEAIADYIALDNPAAAGSLVQRIFERMDQRANHPLSGPELLEFEGWQYRQIIEPPCRLIYRHEKGRAYLLHVVRGERLLDQALLTAKDKPSDS